VIVRVVAYDEGWPAEYEAEAKRISSKPIIDILLEVSDLAELDARSPRLAKLGYEAKGEFGIRGRRYFRRDNELGTRTHQVHAFVANSEQVSRHLAFRDYLISHPEVAEAYGNLKQGLAERFPSDIDAYMDGKDSFVKHYEAQALAWLGGRTVGAAAGDERQPQSRTS
jgi:GrpB-like predicted nucleotidyltransferase (UPF0157 family)